MNKLWVRLSIGFSVMVLAAVFLVAVAGILVGRAEHNDRRNEFDADRRPPPDVVQLVDQLANYYQRQQSWQGSDSLLLEMQVESLLNRRPDRQRVYFLADARKQVVFHIDAGSRGAPVDQLKYTDLTPIPVNDQVVGYLGSLPPYVLDDDNPPDFFLQALIRTLLTTAAVAAGGGIIFGIVMSRSLTAPLNNLAEAARAIGQRKLSRRVEEKGSDEMIAVARAFNEMASDLEQGEQLRRNLLADVAHELRTPLSVLQGNLRAILDQVYPMNEEEMVRLYEHTRFLSRLVNDLHELAQAEAQKLPLDQQPTDVRQLIRINADNFRPAAEDKAVSLHTQLPESLPNVNVDAARITQVLQNLLANALRHTPAGGAVTIGAEPTEDGGVRIFVSDTGEGITPETLPHIFDRFYRTDPARTRDKGGAGLGLAIARAIILAHHGNIAVHSAGIPGQGTTFLIDLPATSPGQAT